MKELEKELSQKASSLSQLKQQLKETNEREERARINIQQLEDQVTSVQPGTRRLRHLLLVIVIISDEDIRVDFCHTSLIIHVI